MVEQPRIANGHRQTVDHTCDERAPAWQANAEFGYAVRP